VPKGISSKLKGIMGILEDFIIQDSSLMDYLWHRIPVYSKSEIIARVAVFLAVSSFLWLVIRPNTVFSALVILFTAHFLNWFFNGHGYQIFFKAIKLEYSARKAVKYIMKLKREAEAKGLHVMVYGSWSRGKATSKSDIDIFVVNVRGDIIEGLRLTFISMKYRVQALINLLSVDIYVIDKTEYLMLRKQKKPEESPIIVNDPTGTIKRIYAGKETSFEEFLNKIKTVYKP